MHIYYGSEDTATVRMYVTFYVHTLMILSVELRMKLQFLLLLPTCFLWVQVDALLLCQLH